MVDNTKSVEDILMRRFPLLCLGILLVLAGCVAGPIGGQEGSVAVTVNNSANDTYTFEVSVVEYPANVTLRRSDGINSTGPIGPGLTTTEPPDNEHYTAVELPDSAMRNGRYTLDPNEMDQSSIEEFPRDFAVVVVIYQDENEIVSWVSATCDGNLAFLDVTMFHYGSGSAYNCEGALF